MRGLSKELSGKVTRLSRNLTEQEKDRFWGLWKDLSTEGKTLLISSVHPSEKGALRESLKASSGLQKNAFDKAEEELLNKGLMGIGFAPDCQEEPTGDVSNRRHLSAEVQAFVYKELLEFNDG